MSGFYRNGSKFIKSPSIAVTKGTSKFQSRSNYASGDDYDPYEYFYNSLEEKTEDVNKLKINSSKTSVVSTSRKAGRHFENLKQRMKIQNKSRMHQKKIKECKTRQNLSQLQASIEKLISKIDSRISKKELKTEPEKVEKPANERKIFQIFLFLATVLIYSLSLFHLIEHMFSLATETERSSFSLFSTETQSTDSNQFNFFSKFLRK
ncbi:hypothetical protein PVAND_013765 [Polypedilum vanderplanki]|uniref:Uncharacterized protein n=1 Tax=Polypedilum vanderplanki TaxID=319348 RepID=A0A9J6CQD6_POLVA|nr:hypothetical protein PVAND_013765 [Polypedilum vanderplanki]